MNLVDVERAAAEIHSLCEALMEWPNADKANAVIAACRHHRVSMQGPFGNVREQLGKILREAERYKRLRINLTDMRGDIFRALTGMEIAMGIHRTFAANRAPSKNSATVGGPPAVGRRAHVFP